MDLSKYDVSDATHLLKCRHQIGRNGFNYTMPCLILDTTESGNIKVVVFGERYWKYKYHIKKIRYLLSRYGLIKMTAKQKAFFEANQ